MKIFLFFSVGGNSGFVLNLTLRILAFLRLGSFWVFLLFIFSLWGMRNVLCLFDPQLSSTPSTPLTHQDTFQYFLQVMCQRSEYSFFPLNQFFLANHAWLDRSFTFKLWMLRLLIFSSAERSWIETVSFVHGKFLIFFKIRWSAKKQPWQIWWHKRCPWLSALGPTSGMEQNK